MNNPVGIPSGWEDVAAWYWADLPLFHAVWGVNGYFVPGGHQIITEKAADECAGSPRDWRVEG